MLDVVNVDVPALLGLDVLDSSALYADTMTNRLLNRVFTSRPGSPLAFFHDFHVYSRMSLPDRVFFTWEQLRNLHRQFAHPSVEKLCKLLKIAKGDCVTPDTLKVLQYLFARCEPCQRIKNDQYRFRVSMGTEDVRFNQRFYMDIISLDGIPVLHLVDEATHFSSARSRKNTWENIIDCWSIVYTGLTHTFIVDPRSRFRDTFDYIAAFSNVYVNQAGVEAHSRMNLGEGLHQPLRLTYRKLRLDHPKISIQLLLIIAVKALNDTIGPDGVVSSALVFGDYPSLRSFEKPRMLNPTLAERALFAQKARRLMAQHMANTRVTRALGHNTTPDTDSIFEPDDRVLIWCEKQVKHRIGAVLLL